MNEKVKSEKRIPSVAESIIGLLLVSAAVLIGLKLGIGSQMALFLGAIVAILVALFFRVPWSEIQATFYKTMSDSLIPIVILMIVGVTVGAWIIGGTVPSLMYFGLKLVSPKIILPLTFVLCAFMAVFTGTSFGSIATMGLALTGVAMGMGMPVPMVVGAVVSGAWFGDKLSPMSDSTNLASAMTGVNLYTHIGSMMWTTIPATIITIVIYTVIGLGYSTENVDMSNINLMLTTLDETFNISIVAIIPAIMMLVVSVLKIPAILGLTGVAVFSIVFAMLMQGESFTAVMTACYSGYKSATGVALVDTILTRGGLMSMMATVALVLIAGIMGGSLKASGVMDVFVEKILKKFIKSGKSLVITTMLYSYFILVISGSQPLGVVMGGPTFKDAYDEMDIDRKVLSRALADTSTVGSPLVPWSVGAAYTMGVLGVTAAYVPYAFLCYIIPVFTVLTAVTGIGMWHSDGTPYWKKKKAAAN